MNSKGKLLYISKIKLPAKVFLNTDDSPDTQRYLIQIKARQQNFYKELFVLNIPGNYCNSPGTLLPFHHQHRYPRLLYWLINQVSKDSYL